MKYLEGHFNYRNWVFIFYYMKEFIDFEGSSNLGKWFLERTFIPNILVHFYKFKLTIPNRNVYQYMCWSQTLY